MKRTLLAATILAIVTAACGGGDDDHSNMNMDGSTSTTATAAAATRTVDVDMIDIAFEPKALSVQRGERIEFVFHNKGKVAHDAFVGDTTAQADHEKEMRESGGHSMGGDENAITVDPGQTGRLAYTFDRPGTVEIGCHQPDHYAAGMKVAVTVA